jgi:RNA-directed DNA polymerase
MPRARPEGSGRKPLKQGMGAPSATAGSSFSQPEANVRLMELVVSRENMMAAFARVVGNKGAAGIDKMSVADLKPYLKEHWLRIKEELLEDRYQPQAVRGVEIPKLGTGGGVASICPLIISDGRHPRRTTRLPSISIDASMHKG